MIHTIFIRLACAAIVLASIFKPLLADAAELPQPTGKIVLTVTGKIGNTNQDGAAVLDLDMLKKFGDDEITTNTIWTQGERHFTGVFMNKLLEALDVQGDMVVVQAINDYRAEIPIADAMTNSALIAYAMDGRQLGVRDKGPLWLVYPFDVNPRYRSEVYYARSVWQIDRLQIEDAQ